MFSYDRKTYSCKLAAQAGIKLQPPHWRGRRCGDGRLEPGRSQGGFCLSRFLAVPRVRLLSFEPQFPLCKMGR